MKGEKFIIYERSKQVKVEFVAVMTKVPTVASA